jgi:histidinol-phosphatase
VWQNQSVTPERPPADPDELAAVVELVQEAGVLTQRWFRSATLEVDTKQDGTPVTEADRRAERFLRDELARRFAGDAVLGEEWPDTAGETPRTWVIDPIDGTKAFAHGVPLYSNLVALDDEHGPRIGIINLPALGETIWAARGLGCWCNGEPARVSAVDSLGRALVTTSGLGPWTPALVDEVQRTGALFRTWGDGYGYALVATGRAEAMIDPAAARWDIAPMPVILAEAGGRFSDLQGGPGAEAGHGVGSNGLLHPELLALFARAGHPQEPGSA